MKKSKTLQGSRRFPAHRGLLSRPAEPEPPAQGKGGRSHLTHMLGSARQGVGRSQWETAVCWWPRGRKLSDMKVARCRQTCKSAAAQPHQQPPNCCEGNLLIATTPAALQGQQPRGEAQRSRTEPNPSTRARDAPPGGCCPVGQPPCPKGWVRRHSSAPVAPHRPLPCTHKFVSASSQKNRSRHSSAEMQIIFEQSSSDWSGFRSAGSANICLLFKARLQRDRN